MQLTINIPDAVATRVVNGFCKYYGYQATIDGQPNPQTKAQFAKAHIAAYIKSTVKQMEAKDAEDAARAAAIAKAESELEIT